MDFEKKVLAIIVLYEQLIEHSRSCQSLLPLIEQGLELWVFDNSREPQPAIPPSVNYYHSPKNEGVSGAYNFAAKVAHKNGKTWLWLLDDDTTVDPKYLREVEGKLRHEKEIRVFAPQVYSGGRLLSPFSFVRSKPKRLKTLRPGSYSLTNYRPINSGLLLTLKSFEKAGGYSTELPLDFSDIEFTDRLKAVSPRFYLTNSHFEQAFSGDEKPKLAAAVQRFRMFMQAAEIYYTKATVPYQVKRQAWRHTLRLTLSYWSPRFLKIFVQTTFRK